LMSRPKRLMAISFNLHRLQIAWNSPGVLAVTCSSLKV
jgi:hypothetical protein